MECIGTIRSGKIAISPEQLSARDAFLSRMKDGTIVKVTIVRVVAGKTAAQVRCHWGLVINTIRREFEDRGMDLATFLKSPSIPEGLPVPTDVIQAVLYACCNDVGDGGERKTLSKMNTIEASRFFDRCRDYAASAWRIVIPEPNSMWKQPEDCSRETESTIPL